MNTKTESCGSESVTEKVPTVRALRDRWNRKRDEIQIIDLDLDQIGEKYDQLKFAFAEHYKRSFYLTCVTPGVEAILSLCDAQMSYRGVLDRDSRYGISYFCGEFYDLTILEGDKLFIFSDR